MKAVETKTQASIARKTTPFFSKEKGQDFFQATEQPFFAKIKTPTVQPKLTIGQPNDPYEKEADAMADQVVQRLRSEKTVQTKPIDLSSSITPFIQAKCESCEEEEKLQKKAVDKEGLMDEIQRKPIFESGARPDEQIQRKCGECDNYEKVQRKKGSGGAPTSIESRLNASKGSGSALPDNTRQQMESSFGADFSGVKTHTGSSAIQMSKDLNAQAFTHGSDIYFNEGKFDDKSKGGQNLLAHELTHVVQQRPGKKIQRQPSTTSPAPAPGVTPPGLPPPAGTAAAGPSKARLIKNEYDGPTIGLPPVDSYDYVFKLFDHKELIKQHKLADKRWDFIDKEFTFFKFPTEIGVMLNLDGAIKMGAAFGITIGPVTLRDVRVGLSSDQFWDIAVPAGLSLISPGYNSYLVLKKLNGRFFGDATIDFQASISGGFDFAAELRADAKLLDMFKIAGLKAGVKASAKATVTANALANINIEFNKGEINFNKFFNFESDFLLQLLFNAYLKAEILGWDFDLIDITFQRDYSKNLLALTLGTPAKISSDDGKPKTEIDIPQTIEKVKKFIDFFKGNESKVLEGERKGESSTLGEIKPPVSAIPAPSNLSAYDPTLGLYLTNERAGLGYAQFEDFMGSNVAVFKYSILEPGSADSTKPVEEKYEAAPNAKGELHSEATIIGKLQRLQKGYKGGQHPFKVTHVFSERKPCSSCQSYLNQNNSLIQTKNTSVFWLVPYIRGGGKDRTAYWENIRNLIMIYGLTPPTIEALKEKYEKPKSKPNAP